MEEKGGEGSVTWELVRTVRSVATKYHCIFFFHFSRSTQTHSPSRKESAQNAPLSLPQQKKSSNRAIKPKVHFWVSETCSHLDWAPLLWIKLGCSPSKKIETGLHRLVDQKKKLIQVLKTPAFFWPKKKRPQPTPIIKLN